MQPEVEPSPGTLGALSVSVWIVTLPEGATATAAVVLSMAGPVKHNAFIIAEPADFPTSTVLPARKSATDGADDVNEHLLVTGEAQVKLPR